MVNNLSQDSQLRNRRIPFRRRVLIAPKKSGERSWEDSFDLSLGGIFITTMLPLNVGQIVDLDMPLDAIRFQAAAEVVWVRGSDEGEDKPVGMALKFINLNPNQKKLIHREITNHTRAGGQLKVGSPPATQPRMDKSVSSARRPADPRPSSMWEQAFEPPGYWWLLAGAAAVVTAVLLMLLF